jgi:hypothetical protein
MADIEPHESFARRMIDLLSADLARGVELVRQRDSAIRRLALTEAYNAIVVARDEARGHNHAAEEGLDDASAIVFGMRERS